ncbi:MAG TPA: galactofuranose ABC transporter, permease protein YjfF [Chthoniobacterales bacterium]|nr:galactofuranose ABC transporter, permease protein YjfF [Chthoniobacterales bacterium]
MNPKYIPFLATAVVLLAVFGSGSLLYPNFGTPRVLVNLLNDSAFVGVAAVGESFVILSGGIDLSVGSMVAFVGILIAKLLQAGCDPFLAMGIGVCVGTVSGAVMGCLIYFFELPPFLVTLAGLFCLRGLGFVINPESIGIDHPFYGQVLPQLSILVAPKAVLPFTAMCFLASVIIGTLLASFTRFGRNVYAIGSNENSARLMGLPVGRTKIATYALAGCFSALGGIVATFYMQSGNPASFVGLELDAIASVVIGGTLLTGGVGFIPGTLMGVLILGLIQQIIIFNGTLNSWWTKIVIGALLLVFIVLQKLISRRGEQGAMAGR